MKHYFAVLEIYLFLLRLCLIYSPNCMYISLLYFLLKLFFMIIAGEKINDIPIILHVTCILLMPFPLRARVTMCIICIVYIK